MSGPGNGAGGGCRIDGSRFGSGDGGPELQCRHGDRFYSLKLASARGGVKFL